MAMSKEMKAMSDFDKKLFVGRVKKFYDKGITDAKEISSMIRGKYTGVKLIQEALDMCKVADEYRKEHSL